MREHTHMIGQSILHYRILEKLGEGGMGIVYKAIDTRLKREVAIKFLPRQIMAQADESERFRIEAQAAAAINHPSITTIHAIEEADDEIFIVMEYVEGQNLKEKLNAGPLSNEEAADLAIKIVEALGVAHERMIVHRDIKSANIMVTPRGEVKIMDFGLAKVRGGAQVTKVGTTVGTAPYMSPEQARGDEVDQRTDLWSFGAVLYEMLVGRVPFGSEYEQAIIYAILNQEPTPLNTYRSDLWDGWSPIIEKALQKSKDDRYQSASELLLDLKLLRDRAGTAPRSKPQSTGASPKPSKTPPGWTKKAKPILGFGILGVALLTVALILLFSPSSGPDRELPPMRTVRITSYPGAEYAPSLSPDGESFAFSWNGPNQDNFDIYVKLVDAGAPLRLTTSPRGDYQPAWSPDGRHIAFIRSTGERKDELYIVPALGGAERKITTYVGKEEASFCWAPDGQSLFVSDDVQPYGWGIYRVAVETAEREEVSGGPPDYPNDHSPACSPDGLTLAITRDGPGMGDLYSISLEDRSVTRLTFDQLRIEGLAWTPDNRWIVYSSNRDGTSALWRVPATGGDPVKIPIGARYAAYPSISRVGNRLVYEDHISDQNIWKMDLREPRKSQPLITSTESNYFPAISPDGSKLVFSSNRTGNFELWSSDIDGSGQIQLTSLNGAYPQRAAWSPDGDFLAFSGIGGSGALHVIHSSGGRPTKLVDRALLPSWSQDGKSIYYTAPDMQIFRISTDGGQPTQITKGGGVGGRESLDGEYVYYVKGFDRPEIWRTPVGGEGETLFIDSIAERNLPNTWTLTRTGIYYIDFFSQQPPTLHSFSFANKRDEVITSLPGSAYGGLALAPDETWFLFIKTEVLQSDIILVENFAVE